MMSRVALVCGVSGQDGSLLSLHLLNKGYTVFGSSRDCQTNSFQNLRTLGVTGSIQLVSIAPTDFRSVLEALSSIKPDEIYNLTGQSSVGLSFDQPVETLESIVNSTVNFLEAIRFLKLKSRYYNAGSSECFGNVEFGDAVSEHSPFNPRSPYAVAKSTAHWLVSNYREAYGIFACTGILFNHESALRPDRFVTRKVIDAAVRIADGSEEQLVLGNLEIFRDWGYAPHYVDGMWRMLQLEEPMDIILASGASHSLKEFVDTVFRKLGMDWRDHVRIDQAKFRPTDIQNSCGNPGLAGNIINWHPRHNLDSLVDTLLETVKHPALISRHMHDEHNHSWF